MRLTLVLALFVLEACAPLDSARRAPAPEPRAAPSREEPIVHLEPVGGSHPDAQAFNRAVASYEEGAVIDAALAFFELSENSGEPVVAYAAEFALVCALGRLELWESSLAWSAAILEQGPKHPAYDRAVGRMVRAAERLGPFPSAELLDHEYNDAFARLPPELLSEVNFLVGRRALRKGQRGEARELLSALLPSSRHGLEARLLVLLTNPASLADAAAIGKLREVAQAASAVRDERLAAIAELALARVQFARGEYGASRETYARVASQPVPGEDGREARSSALLEGAWAAYLDGSGSAAALLLDTLERETPPSVLSDAAYLTAIVQLDGCDLDASKRTRTEWRERAQASLAWLATAVARRPGELEAFVFGEGAAPDASVRAALAADPRRARFASFDWKIAEEQRRLSTTLGDSVLARFLADHLDATREGVAFVQGRIAAGVLAQAQRKLQELDGMFELVEVEVSRSVRAGACEGR